MGNIRNINVNITTNNDVSYSEQDIISVDIQRSITDGSFGIGYAQSDRLLLTVTADDKLPKKTRVVVNVSIDGEDAERLGRFYVDECTRDGQAVTITAYDAMYLQDKKLVKFGGLASKGLAKLTFPCMMQDVLDYIVAYRSLTCDFQCQPFEVPKKPMKPDGSFYTVREILGFIAASHGANAKFDNAGKLTFQPFSASEADITASDAVDFTIDDSEPFEVTGLLFSVDDETQVYIDDVPGSEFDEDAVGVVKCYNPFVTVDEEGNSDIAIYAWSQIGKVAYYGGSITQRGTGKNNCGDVITVGNLKYPTDTETYQMCITDISYSITGDGGFMETLSSQADKSDNASSSSSNRVATAYGKPTDPTSEPSSDVRFGDMWYKTDSSGVITDVFQRQKDDNGQEVWKSIGTAGGGGSGVGEFLNDAHNSERFNDYRYNTSNMQLDHIEGYYNSVANATDDVQGINHLEGNFNRLPSGGYCNHLEGEANTAAGTRNHIEGNNNIGNGINRCHIEGDDNDCTGGYGLHIQGFNNTASGGNSNDIGGRNNTVTNGLDMTVRGAGNAVTACEDGFVSGMDNTVQNTLNGVVGGKNHNINSAFCSAIFGKGHAVNACGWYSLGAGQNGHNDGRDGKVYYFFIGGGSGTQNIFTVDKEGNVSAAGSYSTAGADYAEYFEWLDGNPDNEDRRGLLVALDGDRIVPAHGDDFIGIISSNPSVIGNSAEQYWNNKYKTDAFGKILKDDKGDTIISDGFDQDQNYKPRSQRGEWATVGLVGRLVVIDDGSCTVGSYISARNGIATKCFKNTGARVLKRIDDTHIEVLIR